MSLEVIVGAVGTILALVFGLLWRRDHRVLGEAHAGRRSAERERDQALADLRTAQAAPLDPRELVDALQRVRDDA